MKKDFSEYQLSPYDKYCRVRSDRENLHLRTFCNRARFDPEERSIFIRVDESNENYTMQDLINEDQASHDARSGHITKGISEEDEIEFAKNRKEQEAENAAIIQKMQARYRMNRERPEHNREFECQQEGWTVEPFINVFSGSAIDLSYGEGLLDFIYADFVTPLNIAYRQAYLREKMLQMGRDKKGIEKSEPLPGMYSVKGGFCHLNT